MHIPKFIEEKLRRIEDQNQKLERDLTVNSVLLRKRLRDLTHQDMFSIFRPDTAIWKRIDAKGLHSLNIVQPAVQATAAAVMTAEPKVTIEARFSKDPKTGKAAEVCQAIRDLKTEEQWTPQLNEELAIEPQIAPGVFLHVDWNPYAEKNFTIDEWGESEFQSGGKALCQTCGYEMEVGEVIGADTIPCEHCGAPAEIVEPPQPQSIPVMTGAKTFKSGDTRTRIIPYAEIAMDDRGTQGGNIKGARWMIHRHLEPLGELRAEYPNCPGSAPWSMPLKWQHAMNTGQDEPRDNMLTPDDLTEVKDFYLTPQMYDLEEVEDDFILDDGEAVRFAVKRGQRISEGAFNGERFAEPPVLCFRTVGNVIIDVFPSDFREKFIYISFMANPSTFWGLFLTKYLPMQDVVNHMFTIQMRHTARNARTTKILNSGAFDPEDVEKDVVLTKDPLPYDSPIGNTFGMIPAATISSEPMNLITMVMGFKGEIGGVTPAMQGQASPSEPYAAQRQQKEQSLGLLTPFLKSIALGKVQWTYRQLAEAQENWTEEDFEFLLKLNGEWDEEHIQAFLNCNLETDIILDYEKGSESPRNLLDREMALRQFIGDIAALTQLTQMPLKQELADEILLRIKQFTQVDVDVSNTEAELRLADSRYDKIVALIEGIQQPNDKMVADIMAMGVVQSMPDFIPSKFEEAETEIEFFRDKITKELSQPEPNFLLVSCLEQLINLHMGAAVELGQETTQMAMAIQQPAVDQQNAMAQEQAMMQQAQAEQQMANEKESRESEMGFEREKMAMDRENKMLDASIGFAEREHQAKLDKQKPKSKK